MRWFALDVARWFRKYSDVLDFTGVVGEAGECGCWQDMGRSWLGTRAIQCRLGARMLVVGVEQGDSCRCRSLSCIDPLPAAYQ